MTVTEEPDAPVDQPDDEQVHAPEVVHDQPGAGVEPHRPATETAIERAAEAALTMPGVPGRDEFLALAMQARVLSLSGAAPRAVRGNPHVAFHVAMVGRDLGISPSAALNLIDVIPGKVDPQTGERDYQLSLSPQLLNGQIRRLGLGQIVPWFRDEHACVVMAVGPGGADPRCMRAAPDHHEGCRCDVLGYSEFTWEDARRAQLVGKLCEPGQHQNPPGDNRCGCNQGYKTYPKRMLWWRAGGFAADDYFPEASLGLYAPEALGAVVDEDGRPIDPTTVELPDGYEPPALPEPTPPQPPALTDPDVLWDLQVRIRALPAEQRVVLRDRWLASTRLTYDPPNPDMDRPPIPVWLLPERSASTAQSMVAGFERIAARDGWDRDQARDQVLHDLAGAVPWLLPWGPLYAPLLHGDTPAASEPSEAQGAQQGTESGDAAAPPGTTPPLDAGVFDREVTARWLDQLDDEAVADLLNSYDLDGKGTRVARRKRILEHLATLAAPSAE